MAPRRWPVLCGNVEGADLKKNSQSTTHIDPKVGTGGMLLAHVIRSLREGWEKSGTCLQCVWQSPTRTIEILMVFQPIPVNLNSPHNPSQAFSKNMCHTHGWPQHFSYEHVSDRLVHGGRSASFEPSTCPPLYSWIHRGDTWQYMLIKGCGNISWQCAVVTLNVLILGAYSLLADFRSKWLQLAIYAGCFWRVVHLYVTKILCQAVKVTW